MAELNDISALLSALLSGNGEGSGSSTVSDGGSTVNEDNSHAEPQNSSSSSGNSENGRGGSEGDIFGSVDPAMLLKIMSIVSRLNEADKNTELIMALKPHLKEENRAKADKAAMVLKLLSVLPLLRGDDLF